jgi:hypothetical protein
MTSIMWVTSGELAVFFGVSQASAEAWMKTHRIDTRRFPDLDIRSAVPLQVLTDRLLRPV